MAFICGSFNNQEEDSIEALCPYSPQPSRKERKYRFCCKRKKDKNKNPYSNRGLDKFEALMAELDHKKQKIFTQKGSQYISFVRFVYSNSNDVKPIIVWLRDPKRHDKDHHHEEEINHKDTKSTSLSKLHASKPDHHHNNSETPNKDLTNNGTMIKVHGVEYVKPLIAQLTKNIRVVDQWKENLKRKFDEVWMPSYNLPLFVILVMVFLTFFGRSLAIICTSIAWYLIPTIDGTLENPATKPKKMIKMNAHSRNSSENKMFSSPKPFHSGPINVQQKKSMKKLMSF